MHDVLVEVPDCVHIQVNRPSIPGKPRKGRLHVIIVVLMILIVSQVQESNIMNSEINWNSRFHMSFCLEKAIVQAKSLFGVVYISLFWLPSDANTYAGRNYWKTLDNSFFHVVKTACEISKALNVEPLRRIDRYQLRWFGHVTRMCQERLPRWALLATPNGVTWGLIHGGIT